MPLEDPSALGFSINGKFIFLISWSSLGESKFNSFFKNFLSSLLLKHKAEEISLEWVIGMLYLFARQEIPPSSPNSPCNALKIKSGLELNNSCKLFFF